MVWVRLCVSPMSTQSCRQLSGVEVRPANMAGFSRISRADITPEEDNHYSCYSAAGCGASVQLSGIPHSPDVLYRPSHSRLSGGYYTSGPPWSESM